MLGKCKYHGTLNPKFHDEDHVFGKECKLGDEWNAGRCIHGDETTVTPKSVEADIDLGRDSHYASKLKNLQPIERDFNKTYGDPSIRSDLPLKKEEIFKLMKKYDFIIPEDEYNLMFEVGLKNYPNSEGKMSPKSFISTMRNLKREYQKYRVIENNPC